ncbi:50S ribosomal protein L21e [Candidatus Woesearchaeota archaeon]|nr:50S ribosomal protein L21e [Candidatus Woesearchaeota archaeon]
MKRVGGFRRKTRSKLRKNVHDKGKIYISRFLQQFKINDKVALTADSSYQKGMYHPRFHGKTGTVIGKQGNCYYVSIKDGAKKKKIIIHPIHLRGA